MFKAHRLCVSPGVPGRVGDAGAGGCVTLGQAGSLSRTLGYSQLTLYPRPRSPSPPRIQPSHTLSTNHQVCQDVRGMRVRVDAGSPYRTVDYGPFIKSQLASPQLTLGPYMVQIWSRYPQNLGVLKPA